VVRRVASAEGGGVVTPTEEDAVAAATFPVIIGWTAFALALLSFLGLIAVVLVRSVRGIKSRASSRVADVGDYAYQPVPTATAARPATGTIQTLE
jgi:hypothetical protein